ncbi:MAG: TolC family protein [Bryobacteraceae bacterium]
MSIRHRIRWARAGAMIAAALAASVASGQTPLPQGLTLSQAVDAAVRGYPSIRAAQEQVNAAAAAIGLARTAYLPRVDALAQVNRATRNNVFGMLLPQSVIPSISGPVIGSNNFGTAWGSAIGTLAAWEPFDFGLRRANVAAAEAGRAQSEASIKLTQFEVGAAAAEAYLTLAAAQETTRAAQAGMDRDATIARTTAALVNAQLRPGADAARAEAELAAARAQLARAQQAVEIARAGLALYVGAEPAAVTISASGVMRPPPEAPVAPPELSAHPAAVEQRLALEQVQVQLRALERSYFPRFQLQGAAYARGTDAETNGAFGGGVNGLAPTVQNYAVGFTVTFSVFDSAAIHAREAEESATIRSREAQAQQIAAELRARWNTAMAELQGARQVAAATPAQVSAARAATDQATARYESGLGGIDETAEAQRLLTQAEIDDALARLGVWRGLLETAVAAGDLQPFLAEVGR